ncbi:radical SAM family heme chaperone HemW [Treponema sp.]|uniref:radical SAM family heme chaperone HemW n=1 Tax=Treponema sp. TaxID=166 RepID=UPI00298E3D6E|nr:radical SAM family heme chaperone HemW [Treponema sp.]MCR5613432.1 radical SAM family heme chaperone HemW [Treponema sp.]
MNKKEISIYIHIPFCKSKCIYCDFFSKADCEKYLDSYTHALCNEISFYAKKFCNTTVNTIYIGGGTPSLLSVQQLTRIFSALKNNFIFAKRNFEFTVELNPDDVTEDLIDFLQKSEVNRISLGIQTLKDDTLKLIQRRASRQTCLNALSIINKKFLKRFSVDLISSLPGENFNDIKASIDEVIKYLPEHISLYSLCIEEDTKLYNLVQDKKIDYDSDIADQLWITSRDYLESKGFSQYEVSNFSRGKKSQSLHNLTYWHLKSYLGFGSGATGSLFKNDFDLPDMTESFRYTNTRDIKTYIDFWNSDFCTTKIPCEKEIIDRSTEEFEFLMMGLRLRKGFSKKEYEKRFCDVQPKLFNAESDFIKNWKEKKLFSETEEDGDIFYALTEEGILYLNSFLENL